MTRDVLLELLEERIRQDQKWGEQNHPNGGGTPSHRRAADRARAICQALAARGECTWEAILLEEVAEALAERDDTLLREELVQVAAVAVAWIEAIDRRRRRGA